MRSSERIHVLGVAASLRAGSFNRQLIEALARRAPIGLSVTVYDDLGAMPLFNEDLEPHGGPAAVSGLRAAVARADALLIATPEYNQSMPAVAKNLVDWLSRGEPAALEGKPVAITGATRGPWGTRLSQAALRHTLTACDALVMPTPQVYVRNAAEVFGIDGVVDAQIDKALARFMAAFAQWITTVAPGRE
jgi:chromate reductase